MDLYEQVAQLLDHLAAKHAEVADLLESSTNLKHAESDKRLAEAERTSTSACARVATTIRSRLTEK